MDIEYITEKDVREYLKEHIIRGDRGDGIPNILSSVGSFRTKTRQKSIKKTMIAEWKDKSILEFADTPEMIDRYKLNKALIDLREVPDNIQSEIIEKFKKKESGKNKWTVKKYIMENRYKLLIKEVPNLI